MLQLSDTYFLVFIMALAMDIYYVFAAEVAVHRLQKDEGASQDIIATGGNRLQIIRVVEDVDRYDSSIL